MRTTSSYRKFSFLTDFRGIKNAIGEMRGWCHPHQPKFNAGYQRLPNDPVLNEDWFINTIKKLPTIRIMSWNIPFTEKKSLPSR